MNEEVTTTIPTVIDGCENDTKINDGRIENKIITVTKNLLTLISNHSQYKFHFLLEFQI